MTTWFTLYSRKDPPCEWCIKAKELLQVMGKDFYEIDLDEPGVREMFKEKGFRTVPQIFIESKNIGGYAALKEFIDYEQQEKEFKRRNQSSPRESL